MPPVVAKAMDEQVEQPLYLVGARIGAELFVFQTEHHALAVAVPNQEDGLYTHTTALATSEDRSDAFLDFNNRFAAAKRLKKLAANKNKEVADNRMDGDLAHIQARLKDAGDEQEEQLKALGNAFQNNARTSKKTNLFYSYSLKA